MRFFWRTAQIRHTTHDEEGTWPLRRNRARQLPTGGTKQSATAPLVHAVQSDVLCAAECCQVFERRGAGAERDDRVDRQPHKHSSAPNSATSPSATAC